MTPRWGLRFRASTYEHAHPDGHEPEPLQIPSPLPTAPDLRAVLMRSVLIATQAAQRNNEDAFLAVACRVLPDWLLQAALVQYREESNKPGFSPEAATRVIIGLTDVLGLLRPPRTR